MKSKILRQGVRLALWRLKFNARRRDWRPILIRMIICLSSLELSLCLELRRFRARIRTAPMTKGARVFVRLGKLPLKPTHQDSLINSTAMLHTKLSRRIVSLVIGKVKNYQTSTISFTLLLRPLILALLTIRLHSLPN